MVKDSAHYYTDCKILSSGNFTDSKGPTPSPAGSKESPKEKFARTINSIVELSDNNESEVARRLGVDPPVVHRWRKAATAPGKADIKLISKEFGIPVEEIRNGITREKAEQYFKPLPDYTQLLLERTEKLLRLNDQRFTEILRALVDYAEQCEKEFNEK